MSYNEKYSANEVFTPTKPARATFIERESINQRLTKALWTPGMQIVVYGHSGSGKTTLLVNKLHQTYENHITTRCVTGLTFDLMLLDAFDQLDPFYTSEKSLVVKSDVSSSLTAEYGVIKAQINAGVSEEGKLSSKRIIPPQLTVQTLANLLGQARCCWVLEDFHKVEPAQKLHISQSMKLFMDLADDYNEVRIIAIGAVDSARQVIEYDADMRNRVAEIHVPLMTKTEIRSIMDKGERLLNIEIPSNTKQLIVDYSSGLAAVSHQLCLNICFASGINETQAAAVRIGMPDLDEAVSMYINDASDTLKSAFDKALRQHRKRKYDNGKLIIAAMVHFGASGALHAEILKKIQQGEPKYPSGNLTQYLRKLQTEEKGAIIRYDSNSGHYSFSDPIYRVFAMTLFRSEQEPTDVDSGLLRREAVQNMVIIVQKFLEESRSHDDEFWSKYLFNYRTD